VRREPAKEPAIAQAETAATRAASIRTCVT
jgi:hypothetical protein